MTANGTAERACTFCRLCRMRVSSRDPLQASLKFCIVRIELTVRKRLDFSQNIRMENFVLLSFALNAKPWLPEWD
jgi:hypothetical protein